MRRKWRMLFKIGLTAVLLTSMMLYYIITDEETAQQEGSEPALLYDTNQMHLAVVACGDRKDETVIMIKSALIFSKKPIVVHIFAEDNLHMSFVESMEVLQSQTDNNFQFKLYRIQFPSKVYRTEWINTFKLCATQRIFIPNLLRDVPALLYVDTDVLFLRPMDDVWQHFSDMDAVQLAAMAPEHEDPAIGWYNRFAQHPFYPPLGVNSGIMLMNLTRIRAFPWEDRLIEYFETYKSNITWGDQDLLNILFHYYSKLLYTFSCEWNYRQDHCLYSQSCPGAMHSGVSLLHGSRRVFHNDKVPAFREVYLTFQLFTLGGNLLDDLIAPMKKSLAALKEGSDNNCELTSDIIWKLPEYYAKEESRNRS